MSHEHLAPPRGLPVHSAEPATHSAPGRGLRLLPGSWPDRSPRCPPLPLRPAAQVREGGGSRTRFVRRCFPATRKPADACGQAREPVGAERRRRGGNRGPGAARIPRRLLLSAGRTPGRRGFLPSLCRTEAAAADSTVRTRVGLKVRTLSSRRGRRLRPSQAQHAQRPEPAGHTASGSCGAGAGDGNQGQTARRRKRAHTVPRFLTHAKSFHERVPCRQDCGALAHAVACGSRRPFLRAAPNGTCETAGQGLERSVHGKPACSRYPDLGLGGAEP